MQTVEQVKKRIDYLLERDQATEAEIEKVYNEAVDTLRAIVSESLCSRWRGRSD